MTRRVSEEGERVIGQATRFRGFRFDLAREQLEILLDELILLRRIDRMPKRRRDLCPARAGLRQPDLITSTSMQRPQSAAKSGADLRASSCG